MAEHGVLELKGTDGGTATAPAQGPAQEKIEEEEHPRILEDAAQGANRGYSRPTGRKSEFARAVFVIPVPVGYRSRIRRLTSMDRFLYPTLPSSPSVEPGPRRGSCSGKRSGPSPCIDRMPLAAPTRAMPRNLWSSFVVRPETRLRWHRELVARKWTHERRVRPPAGLACLPRASARPSCHPAAGGCRCRRS